MKMELNRTPFFDLGLEAINSVDQVLTDCPEIPGLIISTSSQAFSYRDTEQNYTSGVRWQKRRDNGINYSLYYADANSPLIHRANIRRDGVLLLLSHHSEPFGENRVLQEVANLGRIASEIHLLY